MSKRPDPNSFAENSAFRFDQYYEFEAPQYVDLTANETSLETEGEREWFGRTHRYHSPSAARMLKLRSDIQKDVSNNNSKRFTPRRALAPAPAASPSPGREHVVKKLDFASPTPKASRKRDSRVVGSGPFSEARQKKAARTLVLDDTESASQPDLLAAAVAVTAPQPFDAQARRLLFQLSPSGLTTVANVGRKASPPPAGDLFAELEKLTISSGGKEGPSRKRAQPASPGNVRSLGIGGGAARIAAKAAAPSPVCVERDLPPPSPEARSLKRSRPATSMAAGASIISKIAPKQTSSYRLPPQAPPAAVPPSAVPAQNPAGAARKGSSRSTAAPRVTVGVEHIVAWEKRTGKTWHTLSASQKAAELELFKENLGHARGRV